MAVAFLENLAGRYHFGVRLLWHAKRGAEQAVVLDNQPATLAGLPAFRVTTELKDSRGVRMRTVCTGMIAAEGFYNACYRAPTLHYFERDLPVYEAMLASFEILKDKKKR